MSFFDAPIARCDATHSIVLTDQTQEQCESEHSCTRKQERCPLESRFPESQSIQKTLLAQPLIFAPSP